MIWIERPELLLPDCSGLNFACPDSCRIQQTTALYFVCFTSAYNKRAAISQKSVSKKPLFINASAPSFTVTALRYVEPPLFGEITEHGKLVGNAIGLPFPIIFFR